MRFGAYYSTSAHQLYDVLKENIVGLKTIVKNINREKTNVALSMDNKVLYGSGSITDYIGTLKFRISPLYFFQVNPVQTETLYGKALGYAAENNIGNAEFIAGKSEVVMPELYEKG